MLGRLGEQLSSPLPKFDDAVKARLDAAGGKIITALVLKDLVIALSVGAAGLLAYSLCLLLATVLPLAAATFLVACVFIGVLWLMRRWSGRS